MKGFMVTSDSMGKNTSIIPPSDTLMMLVLTAGVSKSVTVPAGARVMLLSATGNVFVRYGSAPSLPTGDILDGTAPELNPAARRVDGFTTVGLVAPMDCVTTLAFYG
ncbi:NAD/NADP transhydrogenase alpha subunit-like protein [Azospirillum formosense]|uniref:NAD/NADP transhydrogenase alpha subunit-like protein n=1 Tax=Azospirillum formosense TaxID=861533 RepID=UPI00338D6048